MTIVTITTSAGTRKHQFRALVDALAFATKAARNGAKARIVSDRIPERSTR